MNILPHETPSQQHYLHEYTYPELLTTDDVVIDWAGIMWAGPHRRGMNAVAPTDLWKAWQKAVQKATARPGFVTNEVMAYFQATKGFSRPPKAGELPEIETAVEKHIENVKHQTENIKEVTKKGFSWSYSSLNQFETCPFQWAHERYYRTVQRQETEATIWGSRVHKQLEDYVNSDGTSETPEMGAKYAKALVLAKKKGVEVLTELQLSLDRNLKSCDWSTAWARGIADVVLIQGSTAKIWDWKTGKKKEDLTQLLIFCAFLAQIRPELKEFQAEFVWLKDDLKVGMEKPIARKDLKNVWLERQKKRQQDKNKLNVFIQGILFRKFKGVKWQPKNVFRIP